MNQLGALVRFERELTALKDALSVCVSELERRWLQLDIIALRAFLNERLDELQPYSLSPARR
jgi:hypothetical protein